MQIKFGKYMCIATYSSVLRRPFFYMMPHLRGLFIWILMLLRISSVLMSSCQTHGCRPSGTFSYLIDLPSSSPRIIWNTTYNSIQNGLGCVGNINNIVCPYNGTKSNGYVTLNNQNGKPLWYVDELHNPTLPVMDSEGGIIGTDGHNIVKYLPDGTAVKPVKPVDPKFYPLYSIKIAANGILVFASKTGYMFTMEEDGVPHALIKFSGTVNGANGTFIPATTPLVVGNRVYILTQFNPDKKQSEVIRKRRLYAVDIFQRMVGKLEVAWYVDFESDTVFAPKCKGVRLCMKRKDEFHTDPLIMANKYLGIIYVILPPLEIGNNLPDQWFWGVQDHGNSSNLIFQNPFYGYRMAAYESSIGQNSNVQKTKTKFNSDLNFIWVLGNSKAVISKLNPRNGMWNQSFDLSTVFNGEAEVTSDIMVFRRNDKTIDNILFGVSVGTLSIKRNFVACINTDGKLLWKIPTPGNISVIGQITGISAESDNSDDMIVAFGNGDSFATVFAIQ